MEAILSCKRQTYKKIEIIVVNDCSTDGYTIDVLKKINDPTVTVIDHETNKGASSARNTAVKHSKGCYILALDADDTIEPEFLEKTVPVLAENKEVGFVGTGIRHFGCKKAEYIPPKFNAYRLLYHNFYVVTSLFRKRAWEDVGGFNESMVNGYEDWDFWLSMIKFGWKGYTVPDILFNYRSHGKSKIQEAKENHHSIISKMIMNHQELYNPTFISSQKEKNRYES